LIYGRPNMLQPYSLSVASLRSPRKGAQSGVVLIMALIMLVIISLLASFSMRNATSTEAVSGNVRTTQLAMQAAEIALRYCEDGVLQTYSATPTFTVTPLAYQDPPRWKSMANWDDSTSITNNAFIVIPSASLGGTATFKRAPECMIERMRVVNSAGALTDTSTYLITARGFGPEVAAADSSRSRPTGSEAWLQSTIELE
jgi:type IV pilus assembly protein PilX